MFAGSVACSDELQEETGDTVSTAFKYECVLIHMLVYFIPSRTKWVKSQGHEYKIDAGVIIKVEHDLPIVGRIEDIYVINGSKVLFDLKLYTTHYEPHFRAFVLHKSSQRKCLYLSNIFIDTPVHIRKSQVLGTHLFVLLPYALCTI